MVTVLVLAVALALDAAAVSASIGATRASVRPLVEAAVVFAVFQAGMSALGAWGGGWLASVAEAWDHWVAFGLLAVVGGRMVLGAGGDDAEEARGNARLGALALAALGVATSLDALAAGVTLPLLGPSVPVAVVLIGAITGALSLAGGAAGRWAGAYLGSVVERVAGVVLVAIGVRILVEHLGYWA